MIEKIGKYSIGGEIGRGGMGVVYKGTDPYIGRAVAIKTVRFDPDQHQTARETLQRRFLREAQSAGNLSHPQIVTIYDVGEADGLTYIAMEYVDGASLEAELRRRRFSPAEVLGLASQIADALDYAHARGVVHRDIKPANILLDRSGRVHIVDFGIAHVSSSTMTQTGLLMGTPRYMSPEQVAGRRVDSRSDLFSLAVVVFEMLTGRPAFAGENITTVIYQIVNEDAPEPHRFNPALPATLAGVMKRAMAKDPAARYGDCRQFVADLRRCLEGGEPAVPPETASAAVFDERRHRLLFALGGAIVLLVALLLLILPGDRRPLPRRSGSVIHGPVTASGEPSGPAAPGLENRFLSRSPVSAPESPLLLPGPVSTDGAKQPPPAGKEPSGPDTELLRAARFLQVDRVWRNPRGYLEAEVGPGVGVVRLPAGTYRMGSLQGAEDEKPPHVVTVKAFWLGKTEVTFVQYDRFCLETGRALADDGGMGRGDHPAINVSWHDACAFCGWLAKKTNLPLRLPTEAEWEWAARYKYPWGPSDPDKHRANLRGDGDGYAGTAPVGSFPKGAAPSGALDLAGNVWEWMADWYSPDYYRSSPLRDPHGPGTGTERSVRGGSWRNGPDLVRSANRSQEKPASRLPILGFRVAMDDPAGSGA